MKYSDLEFGIYFGSSAHPTLPCCTSHDTIALGGLLPNAQNQSPPLIYISSSVSVFVSYLLHYKMDQNGDNYSKIFKYRSFYILYRTISRHFCPGNILYLIASRHFCPAIVVSISYIVQSQDISALEISFIL